MIKKPSAVVFNGNKTAPILLGQGSSLTGINLPVNDAFNGLTATLNSSLDGVNFYPIYNQNGELITFSFASGIHIYIDWKVTSGSCYIQLVASGSLNGIAINIITKIMQ